MVRPKCFIAVCKMADDAKCKLDAKWVIMWSCDNAIIAAILVFSTENRPN